jgi:hypothetical protein
MVVQSLRRSPWGTMERTRFLVRLWQSVVVREQAIRYKRSRQIILLVQRVDQEVVDRDQLHWVALEVPVVLELLDKVITVVLELTINR